MRKFLVVFILFTSSLFAHKLNVFTTYEEGDLFVSAYFANGNGCQNCKVVIKDMDDKIIKEALTNNKGEYELKIDKNQFKIAVDAGGGHLAFETITKEVEEEKAQVEEIQKVDLPQNDELQKLKDENRKLKSEIKLLESQLQILELFKIIFGLVAIAAIFMFVKRIKK